MTSPDYFNRQQMVLGSETGVKIKNTSVLVVGVGAGGNELLKNLSLMGFGNFTIVDFDFIEDSNLSRTTLFRKEDIGKSKALVAAQHLKEISLHDNPEVIGIHGNIMTDVGPGIFIRHDIIVCCVDTLKARAYINDWCVRFKKPYFEMGFEKMNVDITFFDPAIDNSPCLREIIGQGDFPEHRNSCSGLKMKDVRLSHIPTIQVASAMAGVLVATEIIKYLQGKSSLQNKMLQYYGMIQQMNIISIDRSDKCVIHREPPVTFRTIPLDNSVKVADFLEYTGKEYNEYMLLSLPDRFVMGGKCEGCGKELVFNERFSMIYDESRWCDDCRNLQESNFQGNWNIISELHLQMQDQSLLSVQLSSLGVPPMALLSLKGLSKNSVNFYNVLLQ